MDITIRPLEDADIEAVVAFSLGAWAPVFASLEAELGAEIYRLLYPDWRSAQAAAVEAACTAPGNDVWVALDGDRPVGFVAVCEVDEGGPRAAEIYMLAVDPDHQGAGVGTLLAEHAVAEMRASGFELAVVATGGDPGHAPARAVYEKVGYTGLRQVRYYRKL